MIKEKFWSCGDDFHIEDEQGEQPSSIRSSCHSFPNTKSIADGEDDVSILRTCIVIDQALHDEKT